MSSNYRYLIQFLCEGIANASGTRATANYYSRLNNVAIRERVNQTRVTNEQFQQSPQMIAELQQKGQKPEESSKTTAKSKQKKPRSVSDDVIIVLEGIKQYSEFVGKHGPRRRYVRPFVVPETSSQPSYSPPPPSYSPPSSQSSSFFTRQQERQSYKYDSNELPPIILQESVRQQSQTNRRPEPSSYSPPPPPPSPSFVPPPRETIPELPPQYFEDESKPSLKQNHIEKRLKSISKETKVPASRTMRAVSFGGLGLNLAVGAIGEFTKRMVGVSDNKDSGIPGILLSEANALKIVDTLCRVRGAALKLGQMMSIQDNDFLGPELQAIFERVRQSADYMPASQMNAVMEQQLGADWVSKFQSFDKVPFAAASIGQVHQGVTTTGEKVAVKIQYPGVAESIESDIKNVLMILKYANVFPDGLFIDHIMAYAKKELSWEVDYIREAECSTRYRELVEQICDPADKFYVPKVFPGLSTNRVITNELVDGIPIDKLNDYRETARQDVKNSILERLLKLFFMELFQFHYMQTDPNWSNFLYDYNTDTLSLIDFGSSRPYSKEFVSQYYRVLKAAIDDDQEAILKTSLEIGFLSGYESESFKKAHIESVSIIGEAIRAEGRFDFGSQSVTKRIQALIPIMLEHRLVPPPEEIYSLHRKLSGLFLLCTKMGVQVRCRHIFDIATKDYKPL